MLIVKIHKTPDKRMILAVCDKELIGKKFEQEGLQLDLNSDFYKGEEKTEEEILNLFKQAYIINLVGKKSIMLGSKQGIIKEVIKIKEIPHAIVLNG